MTLYLTEDTDSADDMAAAHASGSGQGSQALPGWGNNQLVFGCSRISTKCARCWTEDGRDRFAAVCTW